VFYCLNLTRAFTVETSCYVECTGSHGFQNYFYDLHVWAISNFSCFDDISVPIVTVLTSFVSYFAFRSRACLVLFKMILQEHVLGRGEVNGTA
jgi:hypothetical protein